MAPTYNLKAGALGTHQGLHLTTKAGYLQSYTELMREADRPIADDNYKFYEINLNESAAAPWYRWLDYFDNAEPVTDEKFQSNMSSKPLEFLMQTHPNVERPLALFEPAHAAAIQMDFTGALDEQFGYAGEAFVAQIGPNAPPPPEQGIVGQNIRARQCQQRHNH